MEDDNLMQADFFGNCFKEYMFIINVKEWTGARYKN